MENEKILRFLGLATASRKSVSGTDLVLSAVRQKKKPFCVVMAADVSERTKKQLADKCTYYNVPLIKLGSDMYELGKRTGKGHPVAAVAVNEPSLANEILKVSKE